MDSHIRFAKIQCEHVRLTVNSIALKADAQETNGSGTSDWLQQCIVKATDAAISLIDMHIEASQGALEFSYSFEVSRSRPPKLIASTYSMLWPKQLCSSFAYTSLVVRPLWSPPS